MLDWWRRQSSAARFDLHARASLYINFAVVPVLAGLGLAPELGAGLVWVLAAVVAHATVCLVLLHVGLNHYLGRRARPTRLIVAASALTVVWVVVGYLSYPDRTPGHRDGPATGILLVAVGVLVAALAVAVPPPVTVAVGLAGSLAVAGLATLQGAPAGGPAVAYTIALGFVGGAYRATAWMIGVVWELDRARGVEASLAVAEERLRFARDLHDVVGRTLSVVALKAELAAQLAKRGRSGAIDEMLEVRRIAQDSLAELHAVVGGYRGADPEVELAGARSLLASAGIECRVIGDGAALPAPLGWVVREGTTNILRHSEARSCTITLATAAAGEVTITMDNDGVPPGDGPVRFGNGLAGLTERLATVGGTVTVERLPAGRFRLTAALPAERGSTP